MNRDPEKARFWRLRSKRLRPMSTRQQRFNAEFERSKPTVRHRSGGFCEARTPACTGFASEFHHRAGRVGAGVNLPGMLLHVCGGCHRYAHAHPIESYERGWLLKRLGVTTDLRNAS